MSIIWDKTGERYQFTLDTVTANLRAIQFKRPSSLYPTEPLAMYRAAGWMLLHQWEAVIAECNLILLHDETSTYAFATRGMAYAWLNNFEQARADIRRSQELDPILDELARAYERIVEALYLLRTPEAGGFEIVVPEGGAPDPYLCPVDEDLGTRLGAFVQGYRFP
jgi:hypothetical protein